MLNSATRSLACSVLVLLISLTTRAAPLKLPPTAIAEETFFVATLDLTKADPSAIEAAVKTALGERAGEADDLVAAYKKHFDAYATKGAESITVVFRGSPHQQKEPEPIYYAKFKPGSDLAAVEKQIREAEGENSPSPLEISVDGDFLVFHQKAHTLPEAGSEERTKLFTQVLGESDKPLSAALILYPALIDEMKKDLAGPGAPSGMLTLITDAASFRLDVTPGEAVNGGLTIQAADEDAAKRVTDAITGLTGYITAQTALAKQAGAQLPAPVKEMMDASADVIEGLKPEQAGTKITLAAEPKTIGGILRMWLATQKLQAQFGPGAKGGL